MTFHFRCRVAYRVRQIKRAPVLVVDLARADAVGVVGETEAGLQTSNLVVEGRAPLLIVITCGFSVDPAALVVVDARGTVFGTILALCFHGATVLVIDAIA